MEQLISLGVIAVFALIMWIIHESTLAALEDPENKNAIYLDQLPNVSKLAGRGRWSITIIRQSGNFHSSKEVHGGADAALAAAMSTFRRAKIEGVGIHTNTETELHFGRLFHNHRGSNEGKKVGQAMISLVEAEVPTHRPASVSGLKVTMTCDCGGQTGFAVDQIESDLACSTCGKVERLDEERVVNIQQVIAASISEPQARINAGEDSVKIDAIIPKQQATNSVTS